MEVGSKVKADKQTGVSAFVCQPFVVLCLLFFTCYQCICYSYNEINTQIVDDDDTSKWASNMGYLNKVPVWVVD